MQTLKREIVDPFYLKIVAVVLFFLMAIPVCRFAVDGLLKVILIWGGLLLLYDLVVTRRFLKGRNMLWLLAFLLFELVTVALNFRTGLKNNLSLLAYTAVILLLFYPNDEHKSRQRLVREVTTMAWVYLGLCAVAVTISLCTFFFQVSSSVDYLGTRYYIGLYNHRLWGIFSNPNMPHALIGAAIAVIQLFFCWRFTRSKTVKGVQIALLAYTLLVCAAYLCLSQSRTSQVGLMTFIAVLATLCLYKTWRSRFPRVAVAAGALVAALALALLSSAALDALRSGLRYVPSMISSMMSERPGSQPIEPIEVERDTENSPNGAMSGRPAVWKLGMEQFLEKPLFGHGHAAFSDNIVLGKERFSHFHNLIIHSLAANGIVGTAALLGFAICLIVYVLRYLMRTEQVDGGVCALIAFMGMFGVLSMAEVFLFFVLDSSNAVFFVFAGYLTSLIGEEQPYLAPDRMLRGMEARMARHRSGKGKGEPVA